MDFMKVLDQTVREIRREVNLKVLKVPEIEQKVLDATDNEPWGPHGSALSEIAEATKKFTDCQMVMNVLWTRLTDTGTNWRHVYKALAVIEYLIANGSERSIDDILEHSFQISSISGFEFVESNGKDVGINVRKKVETILALLNDKEKIKAVRDKAAANRDKYFGLSSTGITYKSTSKSYSSSDFHHDGYGGIGGPREDDSFKDSYQDAEGYEEETNRNLANKDGLSNSKGSLDSMNEGNKLRKAVAHHTSKDQDAVLSSTMKPLTKPGSGPAKSSNVQPNSSEDDFDDFDPRGSSTAGSISTNGNEVDLLGQSLLIDLMDAPTSLPAGTTAINYDTTSEIDLFADATFVSASSHAEATGSSDSQGDVDFCANQPAFPATYTSSVDLFVGTDASLSPETKSIKVEPASARAFDPFAAVPLDNLEGSDFFGAFTSHTDPVVIEPSQNSTSNINNMDQTSSTATKAAAKKDTFQVKSGIWAGALSRGLIDLNLTAPKMASLADVGIIGGLGDCSDEKGPTSPYVVSAMGAGSNLGLSGFTTTTMAGNGNMSALGQQTVWKL